MKINTPKILFENNVKIYVLPKDKIIFESELEKQNIEYYCDIENQPMFESGIRYFIRNDDRIKIDKILTENEIIANTETILISDYRDGKKVMNLYLKVGGIIFGENGAVIVTIIALFSIISILNAYMMIPARVLYGMSRDGFFIQKGTIVNKGGTPIVSLLISASFTLILIYIGSFEVLFLLGTFMTVIVWGLVYCALIKLRITEPDLPRPHKSWGYPYTSILMLLFSIVLFVGFAYSDQKSFIVIGIILLLSYPLFLVLKPHIKKEKR